MLHHCAAQAYIAVIQHRRLPRRYGALQIIGGDTHGAVLLHRYLHRLIALAVSETRSTAEMCSRNPGYPVEGLRIRSAAVQRFVLPLFNIEYIIFYIFLDITDMFLGHEFFIYTCTLLSIHRVHVFLSG